MKNPSKYRGISLVRVTGIEPAHLAAREPKSRASASSATPAYLILLLIFTCRELTGNKCTVVTQPKSGVSANSTTSAYNYIISHFKFIVNPKFNMAFNRSETAGVEKAIEYVRIKLTHSKLTKGTQSPYEAVLNF